MVATPAALAAALAQHVGAIRHAAVSAPAGGGPEWDALLRHYGVAPFDAAERATAVQCMKLTRGATPGELRMVMGAAARWAMGELNILAKAPGFANDLELPRLRAHLEGLADAETREYERFLGVAAPAPLAAAKPVGPSLDSIFKNAQETSKEVPWAGMQYKNVATLTCIHCGGPQETPSDFMCRYCRRPIAGTLTP